MTIKWNERLSVGCDVLDEDHKELICLINKFSWSVEANVSLDIIKNVINELEQLVDVHFKREETRLAATNYPEYESHKSLHQGFIQHFNKLKNEFNSASATDDAEKTAKYFIDLLKDWLINHIMNEDYKYKSYLDNCKSEQNDRRTLAENGRRGTGQTIKSVAVPTAARRDSDNNQPNAKRQRRADTYNRRLSDLSNYKLILVGAAVLAVIVWMGLSNNRPPATIVAQTPPSPSSAKISPASTISSPASDAQKQQNTSASMTSKDNCGEIPHVKWWGNISHESVIIYVTQRHNGDWKPYIKKWARQLKNMQDIYARGSSASASGGATLKGDVLATHIKKLQKRLVVIKCLAKIN